MIIAVLLVSLAGYGPPSNIEAREALIARRMEEPDGESLDFYRLDVETYPWYPIDVRVARCERIEDSPTAASPDEGLVGGQFCIVEVTPQLDPPYVVAGAFVHDTLGWRYYGGMSPSDIDNYDDPYQRFTSGRMEAKPGSVVYDGDRKSRPNDTWRSPYEAALDAAERSRPDSRR